MTKIEICFLWQVIHRCKTNRKIIILFLLMCTDSCHKLVAKACLKVSDFSCLKSGTM